jgi:hypothetical protein
MIGRARAVAPNGSFERTLLNGEVGWLSAVPAGWRLQLAIRAGRSAGQAASRPQLSGGRACPTEPGFGSRLASGGAESVYLTRGVLQLLIAQLQRHVVLLSQREKSSEPKRLFKKCHGGKLPLHETTGAGLGDRWASSPSLLAHIIGQPLDRSADSIRQDEVLWSLAVRPSPRSSGTPGRNRLMPTQTAGMAQTAQPAP